jgi:hypothetical protein
LESTVNQNNDNLKKTFPFLTCIRNNDIEIVGIVINQNESVISIYDIGAIIDQTQRELLLELGEQWWWESNRKIPINIFLKNEMTAFRSYIKTLNSKDIEHIFGPIVNLNDIAEKRVKRKSIQLVRTFKKTRN